MKPIFWSPSRYDTANLCLMKYYFQYVMTPRLKITTPIQALGGFLHRRKENLFKGKSGHLELRYKSAESYANSAIGVWKHKIIREGGFDGKKILWEYDGQKWAFINEIEDLCIKTYNACAKEEPPLHIELPIKFQLNGVGYNVRIDEIRKNLTIREYKTGRSLPSEFQLKHFPQFTFYALALCCLISQDKNFAETCDISEEERRSFGGNPVYISEKVNLEYYNVKEDFLLPVTHRRNQDYLELEHNIKSLEKIINNLGENIFAYVGRHCRFCQFKMPCDEKISKGEFYGINLNPQLKLFKIISKPKYSDKTLSLFPRRKKLANSL